MKINIQLLLINLWINQTTSLHSSETLQYPFLKTQMTSDNVCYHWFGLGGSRWKVKLLKVTCDLTSSHHPRQFLQPRLTLAKRSLQTNDGVHSSVFQLPIAMDNQPWLFIYITSICLGTHKLIYSNKQTLYTCVNGKRKCRTFLLKQTSFF